MRAIWFPLTRDIVWVFEWADHAYFLPPEAWRKDPASFDPIVAWLREFIAEERVAAARYDGESVVAFGAPRAGEVERMARKGSGGLLVRS